MVRRAPRFILMTIAEILLRGLYVVQGREPRPRTLSQGGKEGNSLCDGPVRVLPIISVPIL